MSEFVISDVIIRLKIALIERDIEQKAIARTPWWRPFKRREHLANIATLEDEIRMIRECIDEEQIERTRLAVLS